MLRKKKLFARKFIFKDGNLLFDTDITKNKICLYDETLAKCNNIFGKLWYGPNCARIANTFLITFIVV